MAVRHAFALPLESCFTPLAMNFLLQPSKLRDLDDRSGRAGTIPRIPGPPPLGDEPWNPEGKWNRGAGIGAWMK